MMKRSTALALLALGLAATASAASITSTGSVRDLIEEIHKHGKSTQCDFTKLVMLAEALPKSGEFYELFTKDSSEYPDSASSSGTNAKENSMFFAPTNEAVERFMRNVLKASPLDIMSASDDPKSKYYPLLKIVNKVLLYHWVDGSKAFEAGGKTILTASEIEDGVTLNDLRNKYKAASDFPYMGTSLCELDEQDEPSTFEILKEGRANQITLRGNDFEEFKGLVNFRTGNDMYDFRLEKEVQSSSGGPSTTMQSKLSMHAIDGIIIPYQRINLKAYTEDCFWPIGKTFSLFQRAVNMVPEVKELIEAAWFNGLIIAPSDDAFLQAFKTVANSVDIPSLTRNPDIFFNNAGLVQRVLDDHIIEHLVDSDGNSFEWPTSNCANTQYDVQSKSDLPLTVSFRESFGGSCSINNVAVRTEGEAAADSFKTANNAGIAIDNAAEGKLMFTDTVLVSTELLQNVFPAYQDLSETSIVLSAAEDMTGNNYDKFLGNPEALMERIERREWLTSERYSGSSILVPSTGAIERLARMIRPDNPDAVEEFSADTDTVEQILSAFFIDTPIEYPEEIYQTSNPDVEVKVTFGVPNREVRSVTVQTNAFYKKHPVAIQTAHVDGVFKSLDNRALFFIDSVPMTPETRDSVMPDSTSSSPTGPTGSQNGGTAELSSTQRRFQIRLAPQSPSTASSLATAGSSMHRSFTTTTREAILADSPEDTRVTLESVEVPDGIVTATYLITYPRGTSRSTAASNARNLANADLTSGLGFSATTVEQLDVTEGVSNGAGASTVSLGLSMLLGLLALNFSM